MTGCWTKTARGVCFLLTILVLWATQGMWAKKKPPLHPVNLNTATAEELQQVPGIGPATADKILQTRKSYGRFKSVDDLQAIRGIGPKRLDKMRKYLTVGNPPQSSKTAKASSGPKTPPGKSSSGKPTVVPKAPPASSSEEEEP